MGFHTVHVLFGGADWFGLDRHVAGSRWIIGNFDMNRPFQVDKKQHKK